MTLYGALVVTLDMLRRLINCCIIVINVHDLDIKINSDFVWCADGEPSDDRRRQNTDNREPAESRRRAADADDTVLESQERWSVSSQDQGTDTHTHTSMHVSC